MLQSSPIKEAAQRESYRSLMLAALRYRDYRLVWFGAIAEHLGEFMQVGAILWLANELTHSPLMLTIVGSCRFMAMILFPIAGGVAADRMNRRNMLIAALLAAAFLSVWLVILAATNLIAVWHLIVISLLDGVAMSFNHPARHTIVPNLVRREHLLNAISMDRMLVDASRMIGMSAAGYMMAAFGVLPIFILRILGCLIAIFLLLMAKIPPTPPASREQSPWCNLAEGFHYLKRNVLILSLLIVQLMPLLAANTYTNFLPIFATDILRVGAIGYGYLQAAPGLGAIIALISLTVLTYYKRKTRLLVGAGIIMGICLLGFSASPRILLSLPLLVVIGGMQSALSTVDMTLVQGAVADEVRGRVTSWREVAYGTGPTGSILFGAIAQYSGVPASVGLLGGICLAVSLIMIAFLPRFRSIE